MTHFSPAHQLVWFQALLSFFDTYYVLNGKKNVKFYNFYNFYCLPHFSIKMSAKTCGSANGPFVISQSGTDTSPLPLTPFQSSNFYIEAQLDTAVRRHFHTSLFFTFHPPPFRRGDARSAWCWSARQNWFRDSGGTEQRRRSSDSDESLE